MTDLWTQARKTLRPHPEAAGDPAREYCLEERMALYNVSAVSIAVIHEGRLVVDAGIGTLAADDSTPVSAETAFNACSVSKAIAAVAALRLVAQGRLALDADVNEFLHQWRLTDPQGRPVPVSLRQLLTHTGGTNVHGAVGYDPAGPVPTVDQVFHGQFPSLTPAVRVTGEPGSAYRYSSGGFLVVQKLISESTEQEFNTAARALVFTPLAMHSSQFGPLPAHRRRAAAHVSTLRQAAPETNLAWPELAAGGLWTTAGDLARLIMALQASFAGEGDFLPVELAAEALRRQTPHRDMGLGLYLLGEGKDRRFSHTGAHLGWRAEMQGWLEGGSGLAVMVNNGYSGSELKSEIVAAILRAYG